MLEVSSSSVFKKWKKLPIWKWKISISKVYPLYDIKTSNYIDLCDLDN